MSELTQQLKQTRGKAYFDLARKCWVECSESVRLDIVFIRDNHSTTGNLSIAALAALCIKYDLPFKTLLELLEDAEILPSGTYDRIAASSGFKVRDALEAGRTWAAKAKFELTFR
jgi:hypothetical protein